MKPGKITPRMMALSSGFRTSSGNCPSKVTNLGESGFHIHWKNEPTAKDINEYKKWFERAFSGFEMAGGYFETKEKGRQAYEKWLKTED